MSTARDKAEDQAWEHCTQRRDTTYQREIRDGLRRYFGEGFDYGVAWQFTQPREITDAEVEAAALTIRRRVTNAFATLDDGPNGDYYRKQARAALEAAEAS